MLSVQETWIWCKLYIWEQQLWPKIHTKLTIVGTFSYAMWETRSTDWRTLFFAWGDSISLSLYRSYTDGKAIMEHGFQNRNWNNFNNVRRVKCDSTVAEEETRLKRFIYKSQCFVSRNRVFFLGCKVIVTTAVVRKWCSNDESYCKHKGLSFVIK